MAPAAGSFTTAASTKDVVPSSSFCSEVVFFTHVVDVCRVVVVLEHKIYVYNFADLKLVDHIETISNPRGLCALCPYSSNTVLVCPGLQRGMFLACIVCSRFRLCALYSGSRLYSVV